MCKDCKNKRCSLAGKHNAFMCGKHTCVSYDDGKEKPRSGFLDLDELTLTWTGLPI